MKRDSFSIRRRHRDRLTAEISQFLKNHLFSIRLGGLSGSPSCQPFVGGSPHYVSVSTANVISSLRFLLFLILLVCFCLPGLTKAHRRPPSKWRCYFFFFCFTLRTRSTSKFSLPFLCLLEIFFRAFVDVSFVEWFLHILSFGRKKKTTRRWI